MATFPTLTPNSRSFTLGNTPQLEYTGPSGANVRFLFDAKRVGQKLTLGFESLTESNLYLIQNHYVAQEGSLLPFDLPASVWSGYDTVPAPAVDYDWRYASPPQITPTAPGRFSLTVELQSVVK